MNQVMNSIQIRGKVSLPLSVGARALIYYGSSPIWTTTVRAIHQVSEDMIIFDTRNITYFVTIRPTPQAAANILFNEYACA